MTQATAVTSSRLHLHLFPIPDTTIIMYDPCRRVPVRSVMVPFRSMAASGVMYDQGT